MEQKRTLSKWISARKYIREFAANYAERYGEDPAEIERDILTAKSKTTSLSTSMNGSAITTARKRKSAPCPHCGRARSSARTSPTAATSRSS